MVHFSGPEGSEGLSWLGVKSLKHKTASTLYTLGCEEVEVYEELHVSRY